jgi:hypothetical protein
MTTWDIANMLSEQPEMPTPIMERKVAKGLIDFHYTG